MRGGPGIGAWYDVRSMQRGELYILSAPSGSGKTTLIDALFHGGLERCGGGKGDLAFSISHTTRTPRAGEREGEEYHFVDRPTFEEMVEAGRFLEWAEVHGNLYGTSRDEVLAPARAGSRRGARHRRPGGGDRDVPHREAHGIFILPPSYAALEGPADGRPGWTTARRSPAG